MSKLVGSILGRPDVYCFAGDWRGVQYLLPDREASDQAGSTVEIFDATSMRCESLTTFENVVSAVPGGQIADAVDVVGFDRWRTNHHVKELVPGACVPPVRYEFLGGDRDDLSSKPVSMEVHVGLAARLKWKMQQLGIKHGDRLPPDFFELSN